MKGSRNKTPAIDPIKVVMMTLASGITAALGTIVALVVPVTVVVFIVLPIVPSSAHLVESYVCDPGWVMDLESWEEYDPDEQTTEVGTAIVCYSAVDDVWIDVEFEVIVALVAFGVLIPGALAGVFGLFMGLMGGLHPERKKKRKKERTKKGRGKQGKGKKHPNAVNEKEQPGADSTPTTKDPTSDETADEPHSPDEA